MKLKMPMAYLTAAILLPTLGAIAADKENEKPRPAQESKSGNLTGSESTKPATETKTPVRPADETKTPARPADAKEDAKTQPRPAQESRGGATTGRDATKSPEKPDEKAVDKADKAEKAEKAEKADKVK